MFFRKNNKSIDDATEFYATKAFDPICCPERETKQEKARSLKARSWVFVDLSLLVDAATRL